MIINDKVVDADTVSVADGAGIGEHVVVMHPSQNGGPQTWHATAPDFVILNNEQS